MEVIRLAADIWVCTTEGKRHFTGPTAQADAEEYSSSLAREGYPCVSSAVYYDGGRPCAAFTSACLPSAAVPLLTSLRTPTIIRPSPAGDLLLYISPEDI